MIPSMKRLITGLRMIIGFAWLNGVIAAKRNPLWVVSYLITPISLFVLFYVWGGREFALNAVIGGIISMATMNGIGLMGDVAFYKNMIKLHDMMVASPMSSIHYMFGLAVSGLLFSVPGLCVMLILVYSFLGLSVSSFLSILLIFFILVLATAGLAFTLATFVKELRYVWPLSNILSFALIILPPVYYPYTLLPKSLGLLSVLIPSSNASMMLNYILNNFRTLPLDAKLVFGLLLAEAVVFLWISLYKSQWREG